MNELEQTVKRYLLGELSESEQSALEEKYFRDPEIFNEVLTTESDLVDGYVRGQLANNVRERFEHSYMTHPARTNRVKFAAALAARLDQIEEPATESQERASPRSWWQRLLASLRGQSPTLRLAMAFGVLLIVVGGVWIILETRRRQRESEQAAAARETEHQQRLREQLRQLGEQGGRANQSADKQAAVEPNPQPTPNPTDASAPHSVSLALTVGGVRGGDSNQIRTLIIPPGTTQARLLLNLKENNYPGYRASLQTIGGVEVFSQKGVKPLLSKTGAIFVFTVPAHKLAAGDYVLTLRGINPDGEVDDLSKSLFRVEKK